MLRKVVAAALLVVVLLGVGTGVGGAASAPTGIDVASYQHPNGAPINWNAVRGAGHSFVFVKATEGTTYTNPYFANDWSAVKQAGMLRGTYHYARPKFPLSSATDQARYFVSRTGSLQDGYDLPPVLDLEDTTANMAPADVVAWARIWLGEVKRLTGRAPIVYTGRWYWSGYLASSNGLSDYRLWLSDYNGKSAPTATIAGWPWTFWQTTSTGSVPGIVGNVDLNRYCCSDTNLLALAGAGANHSAADPFGYLDSISWVDGRVRVQGWGIDPDTTGPIKVHVYANDQMVGEWTANTTRTDVGTAFPGWGNNHGFSLSFTATGLQNVCVYLINTGPGTTNPPLGCQTVIEPGPFPDVDGTHPFLNDIRWLVDEGITTGYDDGLFRPEAPVTREAMASFLWRMAGEPNPAAGGPSFADVPPSHPFAAAINWLAGEGITTGFDDGLFRPGASISREAMAAFLWRMANEPVPGAGGPSFSDVPISHAFASAISWLGERSIAEGYGDGTFRPSLAISRQAMAAMLHRARAELGVPTN